MDEQQPFKPSKQFIVRGTIAISALAIILIVQTTWFRGLFQKKENPGTPKTVGDLVTNDTNGNGIPDWEEKLWGLDPTVLYTNGVSNKQIIEDKKKVLGVNATPEEELNDTDRLARELFTLSTALGQSDEVDNETLREIASKLGASIDIKQISNRYSIKNVRTIPTTAQSLRNYYSIMSRMIAKYDENAADIDVIIAALETGDTSRLPELTNTSTVYNQIAKDMTAINVPIGVANYHLDLVNGFAGVAESFTYLSQMNDNGVAGLVGIAIYRNYNTKISVAIINMTDYLTRYGIL